MGVPDRPRKRRAAAASCPLQKFVLPATLFRAYFWAGSWLILVTVTNILTEL